MKTVLTTLLFIFFVQQTFAQSNKTSVKFIVQGNCEMCETNIEKVTKAVKGVKKADWNVQSKVLKVTYDSLKTNLKQIHEAISEMGYKTDKIAATKKGYDALPFCCKVNGACSTPKKE
jgi:copper chaperone CopZ